MLNAIFTTKFPKSTQTSEQFSLVSKIQVFLFSVACEITLHNIPEEDTTSPIQKFRKRNRNPGIYAVGMLI